MATPVRLPPIATDTTTGVLVRWLVSPGDEVQEGQVIAEVDTAKVLFEVEAPEAGVVAKIAVPAGEEVEVGMLLAWLGAPDEDVEDDEAPLGKAALRAAGGSRAAAAPSRIRTTPTVRRLAQHFGVDLASVRGTGPGGRIVRSDVEAVAATGEQPTRLPVTSRMRQAIASAMVRANLEVPHFYLEATVDTTALDMDIREFGMTCVLLAAVARTLSRNPVLNATYEENTGVIRGDVVNLGVVVALDEGLTVPVIHNADQLDLPALQAALSDLVSRARDGQLRSVDLESPTFTISNAGMAGVDAIVPIVHQPAIGILGVGSRALRPVVRDGEVEGRWTIKLVLACDHRAIDGMQAAGWLTELRGELESVPHHAT